MVLLNIDKYKGEFEQRIQQVEEDRTTNKMV
jgi:hypothetical protein